MEDIRIGKEAFKSILTEYEDNRLKQYDNIPEHEFSEEFERNMQKLLNRRRSVYYPLIRSKKRVAILVAVIVLLLSMTTVLAVDSLRERFFGFIEDIFMDRSQITMEEPIDVPEVIDQKYSIEYIPEGYIFNEEEDFDIWFAQYFKNSLYGDEITFRQTVYSEYDMIIDTEGTQTEEVILQNGMVGFYWSNKGIQNITVKNEEYVFDISGEISREEIIKIAESIKK